MQVKPPPELGLFLLVWVKAGQPPSRGADVGEHLQGEVSLGLDPGNLPLGPDPGQIAVGPGATDLLVAVPEPLEAATLVCLASTMQCEALAPPQADLTVRPTLK